MNKQLRTLKDKIRRQERSGGEDDVFEEESASVTESGSETEDEVAREREEVLSTGQRFVRPLTVNPVKSLKITLAVIVSVLLLAVIALAVLIYGFRSDSDLVYRAARIVPFPAAHVEDSLIGYDDYLFELRSLKQISQGPGGAGEDTDFESQEGQKQLEELQTLALREAQRKLFIRQIAEERDVSVSDEELEEELTTFREQDGGQEQLEESLDDFYGWSLAEFETALETQLLFDGILEQEAESVLAQVKDDEKDFADLAAEHSSDASAEDGGDIGFVTEDSQYVEEFETAALKLKEGEVSQPVRTQFGFHILKATEVDEQEGTRISHILIDPTVVQEQLESRASDASRRSFIGIGFEAEATGPGQAESESSETPSSEDSEG